MENGILYGAKQEEAITTLTSATALTAAKYNLSAFAESLTNGALASGTSWTQTGDIALTNNEARYIHSAGAGTLNQAVGVLALSGRSARPYIFTYTVSSPTGTAPVISITTSFASATTPLTGLDAAGTYRVAFTSATIPGIFTLSGTSGGAGQVYLDDLSLVEQPVATETMHARKAKVIVETAAIRASWSGQTPTTTALTGLGGLFNVGDVIELETPREIDMFRAINAVASNGATLRVIYEF